MRFILYAMRVHYVQLRICDFGVIGHVCKLIRRSDQLGNNQSLFRHKKIALNQRTLRITEFYLKEYRRKEEAYEYVYMTLTVVP